MTSVATVVAPVAADTKDVETLTAVLSRAFDSDPPMNWILRPGVLRLRSFHDFFHHALVRLTLPYGLVYSDEQARGVCMWTPPGKWKPRWFEHVRDFPAWVRILGLPRLSKVVAGTEALARCHPAAPHYYLLAVGVDPAHQGRGIGKALIRPVLERCDRERAIAYLEASTPVNVPLYESLGFAVQREIRLGGDGPPMFPMVRQPQ